MQRHYDGRKLLADVTRTLEETLARHGVQPFSLLGVTTVLEAIASPLKAQVAGICGREMGRLGVETYLASTIARRVALLQSPHSDTVNPMMESIVVALGRAKTPLSTDALRLAAYRVLMNRPRVSLRGAERENASLSAAFASARGYLTEGRIVSLTGSGLWRLNDLSEMCQEFDG